MQARACSGFFSLEAKTEGSNAENGAGVLGEVKVKVKVHTLDIARSVMARSKSPPQKRSGVARVLKGFHSFTCTPTRSSAIGMSHTCLCLPSLPIANPALHHTATSAATPSPPARGSGERCGLPYRGSGGVLTAQKIFHYFQHSGWPLLTL